MEQTVETSYQNPQFESDDQSMLSWLLSKLLTGSPVFDLIKIALLTYIVIAVVLVISNRKPKIKQRYGDSNHRERLYKRFVYSNLEVMRDLDHEEVKLMQETFENTVKNAVKQTDIKENGSGRQKKKRVSFHKNVKSS